MLNKPSAFILDDDSDFNWSLKTFLDRIGFNAHPFSGAGDFFKNLRNQKMPEVCFIDLNLRQAGEGLSILEFLRKTMRITEPVFVVSSACNPDLLQEALKKGATDFFVKPIERHVLLNKLSRFVSTDQVEFQASTLLPSSCIGDKVHLAIDLAITGIHETGVTLTGGHLLGKGMTLLIDGEIIQSITGSPAPIQVTINSIELDGNGGKFKYFALFDAKDAQFQLDLRKWILNKKRSIGEV